MFMYRLIPVGRLLIIAIMLICLAFGHSIFADTKTPYLVACASYSEGEGIESLQVLSPLVGDLVAESAVASPTNEDYLIPELVLGGNFPAGNYRIRIYRPGATVEFFNLANVPHNISGTFSKGFTVPLQSGSLDDWSQDGNYRISVITAEAWNQSSCIKAEGYLNILKIMNVSDSEPKRKVGQVVAGWRSIRAS